MGLNTAPDVCCCGAATCGACCVQARDYGAPFPDLLVCYTLFTLFQQAGSGLDFSCKFADELFVATSHGKDVSLTSPHNMYVVEHTFNLRQGRNSTDATRASDAAGTTVPLMRGWLSGFCEQPYDWPTLPSTGQLDKLATGLAYLTRYCPGTQGPNQMLQLLTDGAVNSVSEIPELKEALRLKIRIYKPELGENNQEHSRINPYRSWFHRTMSNHQMRLDPSAYAIRTCVASST